LAIPVQADKNEDSEAQLDSPLKDSRGFARAVESEASAIEGAAEIRRANK
jgi:hypothetical protein